MSHLKSLAKEFISLKGSKAINDKKRKNSIRRNLEEPITEILLETNSEFKEKYRENLRLLKSSNLVFKVISNGGSPFDMSCSALKGKLDPNGYAYLTLDSVNESLVSTSRCPKGFSGKINALGRIQLKAETEKFDIRFSDLDDVAESYKGKIDENGNISLILDKSKMTFNKHKHIDKVICKFFINRSAERNLYYLNRKYLIRTILEEIKTQAQD